MTAAAWRHRTTGTDRPGAGLRPVAWAEDGTVEAIEGWGGLRAVAVQWHPELLPGAAPHAALFRWLVAEAAGARSVHGPTTDGRVLATL